MNDTSYTHLDLPGSAADAPTVFLFHGTGGDENQFTELAAQLLPGARRIAPRGDVSEAGAARYFRRLAEGRYDMADLARATEKMARFVAEKLGPNPPPLVAGLGYSNGANILASVLFARPALFDRAVLMHPLIPFTPPDQPGLAGRKVLITAGRRDPICPPQASEALAGWLQGQGAEVSLHWHEGGHEIRQDELLAARDFLSAAVT
jgi:phospholipase/carboxylesterase